jgi:hypothetical protein
MRQRRRLRYAFGRASKPVRTIERRSFAGTPPVAETDGRAGEESRLKACCSRDLPHKEYAN